MPSLAHILGNGDREQKSRGMGKFSQGTSIGGDRMTHPTLGKGEWVRSFCGTFWLTEGQKRYPCDEDGWVLDTASVPPAVDVARDHEFAAYEYRYQPIYEVELKGGKGSGPSRSMLWYHTHYEGDHKHHNDAAFYDYAFGNVCGFPVGFQEYRISRWRPATESQKLTELLRRQQIEDAAQVEHKRRELACTTCKGGPCDGECL